MYAIIDQCNDKELNDQINEIKRLWKVIRVKLSAENHHLIDNVFNIGGAYAYEIKVSGKLNNTFINKLNFYKDLFNFRVVLDLADYEDITVLNKIKDVKVVLSFDLSKESMSKVKSIKDPNTYIYHYYVNKDTDVSLLKDLLEIARDNVLSLEVDKEIPPCMLSDDMYFDLTVFNKETEGNNLMSYITIDKNLNYTFLNQDKVIGNIKNKKVEEILSRIEKECVDLILSPISKECYSCKTFLSKGYKNCYLRR